MRHTPDNHQFASLILYIAFYTNRFTQYTVVSVCEFLQYRKCVFLNPVITGISSDPPVWEITIMTWVHYRNQGSQQAWQNSNVFWNSYTHVYVSVHIFITYIYMNIIYVLEHCTQKLYYVYSIYSHMKLQNNNTWTCFFLPTVTERKF